jgi:rhodanese-related sulfurtransferase
MQQFLEFIGNHPILTGLFAVVLAAWIAWEVARLARKWREVGTLEAVRLINREDALVIDVSNSTDHASGHIVGALHMPPSRIEAGNQQLLKHKDRPVLLYCKNGQVSPQMANRLVKLGFEKIHVLTGGLTQWISDQQPVSRHKKASGKKKDKTSRKDKHEDKREDSEARAPGD